MQPSFINMTNCADCRVGGWTGKQPTVNVVFKCLQIFARGDMVKNCALKDSKASRSVLILAMATSVKHTLYLLRSVRDQFRTLLLVSAVLSVLKKTLFNFFFGLHQTSCSRTENEKVWLHFISDIQNKVVLSQILLSVSEAVVPSTVVMFHSPAGWNKRLR